MGFCENCGAKLETGEMFCSNCGVAIPQTSDHDVAIEVLNETGEKAFCQNCGAQLEKGSLFCTECGRRTTGVPGAEESNPTDTISKVTETKPQKASVPRKNRKKAVFAILTLAVVAVVVYLSFFYRDPVSDLKSVTFDSFGTMEFGDAVKANLSNAKWTSQKKDKYNYIITLNAFSPDLYEQIELEAKLVYDDAADTCYSKIQSVTVDDETYWDIDSIQYVMGLIYGED